MESISDDIKFAVMNNIKNNIWDSIGDNTIPSACSNIFVNTWKIIDNNIIEIQGIIKDFLYLC